MEVVLGVSMQSTAVRMVLLEGRYADGATVEDDAVPVAATRTAPGHVVSAILGTRQGAAAGGYRLTSTGVAWTDPAEAAALQQALADNNIRNVTLVSAFLAAAALTQTVGQAIGYRHTAMLLVDPNFATVAVIDSDDGSIAGVRRQRRALSLADTAAQLAAMVAGCTASETHPDGVFLVGQGVDTARLKEALEAVTPLTVSAPEDPETALARGAALASANAPLFVLSTDALAYAQDPCTDQVSEIPAEIAGADTAVLSGIADRGPDTTRKPSRPMLLASSVLAVIFTCAAVALEIALAINIRTTVALQPSPEQNIIVPTKPAPAAPSRPAPVARPAPTVVAPRGAPPNPPQLHMAPAPPAPVAAAPVPVPVPVVVPAAPLPPVPNIAPLRVPRPPRVSAAPLQLPKPPAVQLPKPPALQLPKPPAVQLPKPPALQLPKPPALQLPKPPAVQLPKPPALQLPKPPALQLPKLPAPQPLRLPTPALPKAPALPAPSLPIFRPPAPMVPRLPALPRFPLPHFGLPHFGF